MATEKDNPRLTVYAATSRNGVKSLARTAARSDEARLASKTVWDAQWIGVIQGYPKTREAFEARRERGRALFARLRAEGRPPTRLGVPDGWARRKPAIAAAKQAAAVGAVTEVGRLIASGTVMDEEVAHGALRVAFGLLLDETQKADIRLKAVKLVAEFLKPKPTAKIAAAVSPAEEWLAMLNNVTEADRVN